MLRISVLSLVCSIGTLFSSAAWADSVFVRDTSGTAVTAEERTVVKELVQAAVPQTKGYRATDSEKGADIVLDPRVVKLGTAYILTLNKTKGADVLFSRQLRAKTFDEMDTVATRLVRAVLNETEPNAEMKVSEVTEDDAVRGTRRREATKQWLASFGPAWATKLNAENSGVGFSLGYVWGIDPRYDIRTGFEVASFSESSASYSNFFVGVNYHFNENDVSPYVMADFGYGGARAETNSVAGLDDKAAGFTATAGAGIKFFRTSKVNLTLGVRSTYMFDTTYLGNPTSTAVMLGVLFNDL